jgi:small subunit ribosomal protein S16e
MSAVSCYGKKKTSTAVAHCKEGKGLVHLGGTPIGLIEPESMRLKALEPMLVVGMDKFRWVMFYATLTLKLCSLACYYSPVDIRVRVSGGGHVSQVYAIRQAIAKSLVAFYAKNFDAASALELRQQFIAYDRTLLIADPRRMEPKKFGGQGARARSEYISVRNKSSLLITLSPCRTKVIPIMACLLQCRSSISFVTFVSHTTQYTTKTVFNLFCLGFPKE